jgi:hypothetical protein
VGHLGHLAGELDAGRAGTDDDEGQETGFFSSGSSVISARSKAPVIRARSLQGVVDALHARGELGEVVVAEVGLSRHRRRG